MVVGTHFKSLVRGLQVNAHYFEEGNVQLETSHECTESVVLQVLPNCSLVVKYVNGLSLSRKPVDSQIYTQCALDFVILDVVASYETAMPQTCWDLKIG